MCKTQLSKLPLVLIVSSWALGGTYLTQHDPRPDSAAGNFRKELKASDCRKYRAERDQREDERVDSCTGDVRTIRARQNWIVSRSLERSCARNGRRAERDKRRQGYEARCWVEHIAHDAGDQAEHSHPQRAPAPVEMKTVTDGEVEAD